MAGRRCEEGDTTLLMNHDSGGTHCDSMRCTNKHNTTLLNLPQFVFVFCKALAASQAYGIRGKGWMDITLPTMFLNTYS